MEQPKVDRPVFASALILLLAACLPLLIIPARSADFISRVYGSVTDQLGFLYLWSGIAVLAFCVWIASSRFGRVKLGDPDEPPQYSNYSWAAMLFCAGVATGILYLGTIEWTNYYVNPPYGLKPRSVEAIEWASTYGIFHWGPTGWAYYCLPTLAIGYAYYVRKIPRTRVSTACQAVIGDHADGLLGKIFDLIFMVGLMGAAGTSLGLGTPMLASGFKHVFESINSCQNVVTIPIPGQFGLSVFIVVLCTGIFGTGVYLGLDRGIKRLSDINMAMTFLLLLFVLFAGPTVFIMKMGTNSLGVLFQNFIRMHTWTDPLGESRIVEDWTVFYWAWWIAVGPFMGIFVAEISRGRTIRQVIVGTLTFGVLGCFVYYVILGNYALHLELNNIVPLIDIKNTQSEPDAIIAVFASLPISYIVIPFFCAIGLIFLATTYSSASYALASSASVALPNNRAPARWHRLFWAFALALLPVALLLTSGDFAQGEDKLKALRMASLLVSLPLMIIFVIMAVSLVKSLREDEKKEVADQTG